MNRDITGISSTTKRNTRFGGVSAINGMYMAGAEGLKIIKAFSKASKGVTFKLYESNSVGFGRYYVRDGKFAMLTSGNPDVSFSRDTVTPSKIPKRTHAIFELSVV